jgi:hypothetical protein
LEVTCKRQILVHLAFNITPRKHGSAQNSGVEGITVDIITHKWMQKECLIGALRLSA